MEPSLTFSREIPVRHTVDVCIAGGGPSGVAAALAAARSGASVFVIEGQSCFGGMGTVGLVPAFMRFGDGITFLAQGVGSEIYTLLKKETTIYDDRVHDMVGFDVEALKRIYDRLMKDSGADFTFNTHLIAVEAENGVVKSAICAAKSGLFAVRAKVFIDCTGDGDLAAWAGAPYEKGDENGRMMPGTLCSLWANFDWDAHLAQGKPDSAYLEQAFREGIFSIPDRHLPGMFRTGKNTAGGNLLHTFGADGTDERSMTEALLWGRELTLEYERYYRRFFPESFSESVLVATGGLLGIRESRRILGDYVLDTEDFKNKAVFADEIGRYCYPVDLHPQTSDLTEWERFEEEYARMRYQPGDSYGIPYRILTPRGMHNLLTAGRCVSADRTIQGSIRVMPGCYLTGQAAGMAAYMAVEGDCSVREISIPNLQQRLIDFGAYLPNAGKVD